MREGGEEKKEVVEEVVVWTNDPGDEMTTMLCRK